MIQEVFTDPVHAETPWADPYGTPPPPQTPQTRMEREYVWAAHEGAGVNELHVAIDWFDREAWAIQDAHNQTVMGYADAVGDLVEQRVYTPFGQILNADKTALANPGGLYSDFRLRVGFQGMFADRLDADTTQPVLRHGDARVVYLTNQRVYEPLRGSWMQRDPNASGSLTLSSLSFGGLGLGPDIGLADIMAQYGDGMSLSLALGANPMQHTDPSGLFLGLGGVLAPAPTFGQTVAKDLALGMGMLGFAIELQQVINGQQSALEFAAGVAIGAAGGGALAKLFDFAIDRFRNANALYRSSRTDQVAGVTLNNTFSGTVEDSVRAAFGGSKRRFQTSIGSREMDSVTGKLGIEVKTGYQSGSKIKLQAMKDKELLQSGTLTRVEWHFYDGRTGNVGRPSGPVRKILEEAGITIREFGPPPLP